MNMPDPVPASALKVTKLAITDATALYAWRESADTAAGAWLCEKYRPLILHMVSRQFASGDVRQEMADETLRRALSAPLEDLSPRQFTMFVAQIAIQVCGEYTRSAESNTGLGLAA
jgi:hypothetical protein